jgi:hypothetical protein
MPHQIDIRLVPIMALLYLLSHIDRANIGNAKIEGMDKDLGLTGNQYNIATTIFFVPYIIFGMFKWWREDIWMLTASPRNSFQYGSQASAS